MMRKEYFNCNCSDNAHTFVLMSFPPGGEAAHDYLYVSMFLNDSCGFWRRAWRGIKYIFGHKSVFGDWDEILLCE